MAEPSFIIFIYSLFPACFPAVHTTISCSNHTIINHFQLKAHKNVWRVMLRDTTFTGLFWERWTSVRHQKSVRARFERDRGAKKNDEHIYIKIPGNIGVVNQLFPWIHYGMLLAICFRFRYCLNSHDVIKFPSQRFYNTYRSKVIITRVT